MLTLSMNQAGQLQQNCPQTQKERKEKHQKHQRNRSPALRSKHEKFAFEHHTAEKSDKSADERRHFDNVPNGTGEAGPDVIGIAGLDDLSKGHV